LTKFEVRPIARLLRVPTPAMASVPPVAPSRPQTPGSGLSYTRAVPSAAATSNAAGFLGLSPGGTTVSSSASSVAGIEIGGSSQGMIAHDDDSSDAGEVVGEIEMVDGEAKAALRDHLRKSLTRKEGGKYRISQLWYGSP
jgi:hypothetical protein